MHRMQHTARETGERNDRQPARDVVAGRPTGQKSVPGKGWDRGGREEYGSLQAAFAKLGQAVGRREEESGFARQWSQRQNQIELAWTVFRYVQGEADRERSQSQVHSKTVERHHCGR